MGILEFDRISKIYPAGLDKLRVMRGKPPTNAKSVTAVNCVTLGVEEGEIIGLLGSNGAGKTTLLKMAAGLVRPTSGAVRINGREAHSAANNAAVGAVIEAPQLMPRLSGMENLNYLSMLDGDISRARIESAVDAVGLRDRINDKFYSYSLGMKQRLCIAQALMTKPSLLLLDEPINGLDPEGIIEMRELFDTLARKYGVTIVISSHILSEIENTCARAAVVSKGELKGIIDLHERVVSDVAVVSIGCDEPMRAQELFKESYEGRSKVKDGTLWVELPAPAVAAFNKILAQNDISVFSFNVKERSLEDVYKEMIK